MSDRWRRSLQLRVITATLVLSAIVVSVLGYVLMQHLITELYNDKVQSSVNIVDAGLGSSGVASSSSEFTAKPNLRLPAGFHESTLARQLGLDRRDPVRARDHAAAPAYQGPPVYSRGAADGFYGSLPGLPKTLVSLVYDEKVPAPVPA